MNYGFKLLLNVYLYHILHAAPQGKRENMKHRLSGMFSFLVIRFFKEKPLDNRVELP